MHLKSISLLFLIFLPIYIDAETIEDNPEIQDQCQRISDKLASLSYKRCISLNFELSGGRSVNGLPILVKYFYTEPSNNGSGINETDVTDKKRILLIGGIHGNEYASISIIYKWIKLLNESYTGSFHWQIIPLLNPDGLLQNFSKLVNANGVDLDRNFYISTGSDNHDESQYWEEFSRLEPESQWLASELQRYKPDAIITVHAPNSSHAYKKLKNFKPALGAQYQNIVATYPDSFNQYAGTRLDIPILTVELPYADVMPTNSEVKEIWKNLIEWLNERLGLS